MKKKICILTSGHPPTDDRIFWRFALSLIKNDFEVTILCSTQKVDDIKNDVKITGFDGNSLSKKEKVENFFSALIKEDPVTIICSEPLTILPAYQFKKNRNNKVKIILDVTEYYPHQNLLNRFNILFRIFPFLALSVFNIFVSSLVDHIIVGEKWKARQYILFVPFVKKSIIGYYAPKRFFNSKHNQNLFSNISIGFSGSGSSDRGFSRFLQVITLLKKEMPEIHFSIRLFGKTSYENQLLMNKELSNMKNLDVEQIGNLDYPDYCSALERTDLLVDLRDRSKIFNKSLPITFFDFIAACKPFVFSDLNSFDQLEDIRSQIELFDPDEIDKIKNHLKSLILDKNLYHKSANVARTMYEEKYNWEILERDLIEIVNN